LPSGFATQTNTPQAIEMSIGTFLSLIVEVESSC